MKSARSKASLPGGAAPLYEAVFKFFGQDESRSTQRAQLNGDLNRSYRPGRAVIDWNEGSFGFRYGPLFGTYRPWNVLRFFDKVDGWADDLEKNEALDGIRNCWQRLQDDLKPKLYRGELSMWGRPSPWDEFYLLPIDVWPHFSIEDWEHGRGSAVGGHHIYSIYLALGATIVDRDGTLPEATPGSPRGAKSVGILSACRALFPNGIPPMLSAKDRNNSILKWLKENGGTSGIGPRQIQRVLKDNDM